MRVPSSNGREGRGVSLLIRGGGNKGEGPTYKGKKERGPTLRGTEGSKGRREGTEKQGRELPPPPTSR